ncbi:uncharacterized protein LOC129915053 [Episyrphus balteatus]|uniref:uncharacterized protein LOC129915053 n=1 Tax=Episyrphus balteatus TaxID=286459 RepID=UPI002485F29B|nr:uncharacterized protein LOC129915053 [Episyrphus balteatus]
MQLLVFLLSFLVLVTLCASQDYYDEIKEKPCNLAFRCRTGGELVWASTDNESCEVYPNNCMFESSNCNRQNNYESEAIDIGQEECQKLCKTSCVGNGTPICGYYEFELRNFGSQCEMDNFICATGQIFDLYSEGLCPASSVIELYSNFF